MAKKLMMGGIASTLLSENPVSVIAVSVGGLSVVVGTIFLSINALRHIR
jgi:hypothetical protein